MEQPTISDTVEVEIGSDEVLLNFDRNLDADQFREWWEQEGWGHFSAWATDAPTRFVLVYQKTQFFVDQNLYLGAANLTTDLSKAALMTKEDAESKWSCMNEKEDWCIWSVASGRVLHQESIGHIARAKRAELEAELARLRMS